MELTTYKLNNRFPSYIIEQDPTLSEMLLERFRIETNKEPFYYITFFYNDYERKMINFYISSKQPNELLFQSNIKDVDKAKKYLTKLNKHIIFEDECQQYEAQEGFVKNQIITKLKIKTYGLQ